MGVTQGLPLLAFTIALQFISSGVLTIFIALIPLVTGLMAHVWLNQERLGFAKAGGLAVAFGGVLLLVATRTTGLTAGASGADVRGYGLALAGALVIAASVVYTRRRLRHVEWSSSRQDNSLLPAWWLCRLPSLWDPSTSQP